MCLSTVYKLGEGGTKQLIAEYVSSVTLSGDTLTLTDIMGKEILVSGFLETVDLVKNIIIIHDRIGNTVTTNTIKKYEMTREIFNSCGNSRMRDVDIREIETDNPDAAVKEFLGGKNVNCEKIVKNDGTVIFDINADGLAQRVTYVALDP
ncbi:MAG: CooT family nickel-binding protein [Spirochaetaceae bacterium]|jgi:predicted RNA-binding protein|nr:CooT family nickel-binding protein [Spirochaetaceae bacterium]